MDYIKLAKALGFADAKIMKTSEICTDDSYRKLCVQNVCGNYDLAYGCPPKCGTVQKMIEKMNQYENALILQTKTKYKNILDREEQVSIQRKQNKLTEVLHGLMVNDGLDDILLMSAGPWKRNSCLSAYCIDAQKMAETVGMTCWEEDGYVRYFTLLLYH
ncbi:MAG: DUF2284 domain-containing protein [Eubacteriales bacterium]|nr:DUF2284 domain-containing protein [Eubacteriales bacterium]